MLLSLLQLMHDRLKYLHSELRSNSALYTLTMSSIIRVGVVPSPILAPDCLTSAAFVDEVFHLCPKRKIGWPGELLILLQMALKPGFRLKIVVLRRQSGESFSGMLVRSFASGEMDLNGVPISWSPKRQRMGADVIPIGPFMFRYSFVVHHKLATITAKPINVKVIDLTSLGILLLLALTCAAVMRMTEGTSPEATFQQILSFLSSVVGQSPHVRSNILRISWALCVFHLTTVFNLYLKSDLIRVENRPFESSGQLAGLLASRKVRLVTEEGRGFFQRLRSPKTPSQRALAQALARNPIHLTKGVADTQIYMKRSWRDVFLYRNAYSFIPRSHYIQPDLDSRSEFTFFFLRSNTSCANCTPPVILQGFKEAVTRFAADNERLVTSTMNIKGYWYPVKEDSITQAYIEPVNILLLRDLAWVTGFILASACAGFVLEKIFSVLLAQQIHINSRK